MPLAGTPAASKAAGELPPVAFGRACLQKGVQGRAVSYPRRVVGEAGVAGQRRLAEGMNQDLSLLVVAAHTMT